MRINRPFPDPHQALFGKVVTGLIVIIVIIVIGGIILTAVNPKLAGELQAPAIEAQDAACSEGCKNSLAPDACYDGCMWSYRNDGRRTGF